MALSSHDFMLIGQQALNKPSLISSRQWESLFHASPAVCAYIWAKLIQQEQLPRGAQPHHLLWCLAFLKVYGTEGQMEALFRITRKTYRQWVWLMMESIYYMDVVSSLFMG